MMLVFLRREANSVNEMALTKVFFTPQEVDGHQEDLWGTFLSFVNKSSLRINMAMKNVSVFEEDMRSIVFLEFDHGIDV